jgi:cell wall-associated NlpC family hydrolase
MHRLFRVMRRNAAAGTAALCIFFAGLFSGCLTPAIRYGRPKVPAVSEQGTPFYGGAGSKNSGPVDADRLKKICSSYLGTPYLWGGMSRKGADCSGFVGLVIRELKNITLPRSAVDMMKLGSPVEPPELRAGDLVFFRWGFFGTVDHVGICTGEARFVHASSKLGVIESSLSDNYYRSHLIGGRRLFQ